MLGFSDTQLDPSEGWGGKIAQGEAGQQGHHAQPGLRPEVVTSQCQLQFSWPVSQAWGHFLGPGLPLPTQGRFNTPDTPPRPKLPKIPAPRPHLIYPQDLIYTPSPSPGCIYPRRRRRL